MTTQEAKKIALDTITYGLRHADYEKAVEIARKSKIFVTGEGQDDEYLVPMRDKETGRQKQIRVKVTKPITPFALNPVKTEFQKMFRVDGVSMNITAKNESQSADLAILSEALGTFFSNASINSYFERRFVHFNFIDPNAWMITERRSQRDETGKVEKIDTYPFEVSSEAAVNYAYDNGVPVWLIVKQERMEAVTKVNENGKDEMEQQEVSDYYFYAAGIALHFYGFIDPANVPDNLANGELIAITQKDSDEETKFVYNEYETGSTEFPGEKFGAYDAQEGDGTLKVPPFWDGAMYILEDLIETKSVFDVSRYNHVFPKLFYYQQRCKHTNAENVTCEGGYMGGNHNHICPSCQGTGGVMHFGESDVIAFYLPDNLEDFSKLPKLPDMAFYHDPPLDVTKELYTWIKDFLEWVYIASFNSTNVDKAFAAKTATEINTIYDAINARVYHAASWWSWMTEKSVRVTSQYLEQEVTVNHSVPMDMKLESLDVLIARYESAIGLPYEVKQAILFSILGKTFLDNPAKVESIKAWEYWKPFKSMTSETVLFILQSRSNDDFDKLLFENWDAVQTTVNETLTKTPFAMLSREKQYKEIQKAIEIVKGNVKYLESSPEPMPDLTNDPNDPNDLGNEV